MMNDCCDCTFWRNEITRAAADTKTRILATPDRKLSPAEHALLDAYYAENPLVVAYARAGL